MINNLDLPLEWKEYYSKYPHGFTIWEAIVSWTDQVNLMIEHLNLTDKQVDKLFTKTLPENVENVLNDWYASGLLATLINVDLMAEATNKIADISLNVKKFGAKGDWVTDDSAAIQAAIDYASTMGEQINKQEVYIPFGRYNISNLILPRGVKLKGDGILYVKGAGNFGVKLLSALYCQVENISIELTDINQTAIIVDKSPTGSYSQFNTFRNVTIEGGAKLGSKGLEVLAGFTMSFYDCKFLRCDYGVVFNGTSNALFFYGCEIRNLAWDKGVRAIHQLSGDNNAFIGGAIETHAGGVKVEAGTLTLDNVYTESLGSRAFQLTGTGILIFKHGLVKSECLITGGKALIFKDCDMSRGGFSTNSGYPFIKFEADVNTMIRMEDNIIPEGFYHAKYGQWFDGAAWVDRSPNNINEVYLDRKASTVCNFDSALNATGDSVNYIAPLKAVNDPYGQIVDGQFVCKDPGEFKVSLSMRLRYINPAEHSSAFMIIREVGAGAVIKTSPIIASVNNDGAGYMRLEMNTVFTNLKIPMRVEVCVQGTAKTVQVVEGYCYIERIA